VEDILNVEYLEKEPETHLEAIKFAKKRHKFTLGVFYQTQKPTYHIELYGDDNPITNKMPRDERLDKISDYFPKSQPNRKRFGIFCIILYLFQCKICNLKIFLNIFLFFNFDD